MNMIPPAIGIFSALLKNEGHDCRLFDTTYWEVPDQGFVDPSAFKEDHLMVRASPDLPKEVSLHESDVYESFSEEVASFEPHLIAVSCTEDMFRFAADLVDRLKDRRGAKVIFGGVFPTFAPIRVAKAGVADFICVGEGENALLELCSRMESGLPCDQIQGVWTVEEGSMHRTGLALGFDVSDVPILDVGIIEEARYYRPFDGKIYKTFPVETHRGCPYKCAYCNSPSQSELYKSEGGKKFFRLANLEKVKRELLYYKNECGAEYIYFWADTFLAMPDAYFNELVEMYRTEIGLPFWCQTRPETLTDARVSGLKKMGIHRMALGIEHGNPDFRWKVLRRRLENDDIVERLSLLNEYDIKFSVNNIIGFPTETRELALDTLRLNRRIQSDTRNIYTFTPFHGTPLRDMAVQLGYINDDLIASSLVHPSILDMPQFSSSDNRGLQRCFAPYVMLDESRWPQIEAAEALTPEGDSVWRGLMEECRVILGESVQEAA